jgi:hypothetical protein
MVLRDVTMNNSVEGKKMASLLDEIMWHCSEYLLVNIGCDGEGIGDGLQLRRMIYLMWQHAVP